MDKGRDKMQDLGNTQYFKVTEPENGVKIVLSTVYEALTEKGLQYGENAVNPHNQKEVQPLYYEDSFNELYQLVI